GLGKITVKAEAMDKSNVSTTKVITVVEAKNLIESIKINGPDTISEDGAVVKLTAEISPETASNTNVSWKITDGREYAEIDRDTGELKALADGKVTVMASAKDGSGISATKTINITGQSVKATKI
ncbi:Cell wall/surface repeat protein, partial [human gut metagenome]